MNQWNEFERAQMAALKPADKQNFLCVECGATWFETIKVHRVDPNKFCAFGQPPLPEEPSYYVIKCIRCGEIHEPPTSMVLNNSQTREYVNFIKEINDPEEHHGGRRKIARESKTKG